MSHKGILVEPILCTPLSKLGSGDRETMNHRQIWELVEAAALICAIVIVTFSGADSDDCIATTLDERSPLIDGDL